MPPVYTVFKIDPPDKYCVRAAERSPQMSNDLISAGVRRLRTLGDIAVGTPFDCSLLERVRFLFDVDVNVADELCRLNGFDPNESERDRAAESQSRTIRNQPHS